jgi:FkbM family methyltransferase
MKNPVRSVAYWLLATESPWNPKAMAGRVATAVLPESALHAIRKSYYARLVARIPEDFMETDARVVRHLVADGDHVVDIGASIGIYTKFLARLVGPAGRVWSFEPIHETYEFLLNNIARLGLKNVEVIHAAVSDREGVEKMVIPTYRWGSDCFYDARLDDPADGFPVKSSWKSEEVASTTLDASLGQAAKISFIKCDANYHELACLRGGLNILRKSKPAMLIEVAPDPDDPGTTAFETFTLLRGEGYGVYWLDGGILRARHRGERSPNYFFLTPEHIASLRARGAIQVAAD